MLLHSELTGRILRCAIAVHRALGPGFPEAMYQSALDIELRADGLRTRRESLIEVLYRGASIGDFRADIVVENLVIVELKALACLGPGDHRQLLNYLRVSEHEVGLLLNFGGNILETSRKIFTNNLKSWLMEPLSWEETAKRPEITGVRRVSVGSLDFLASDPNDGDSGKQTA